MDSNRASKSFNVYGITFMCSRKVCSGSFYQGCVKKATAKFRIDIEQENTLSISYKVMKKVK